jgi:hemoglobin-like flavoprotein
LIGERQRQTIQETFEQIRPVRERVGEMLNQRLLEKVPAVGPLFGPEPLTIPGDRLIEALEYLVDRLETWPAISEKAAELGAQHAELGVQADQYAAVGAALIGTLREVLGAGFTEEAEEAWEDFYTDLSLAMERGGRNPVEKDAEEHRKGAKQNEEN